MTDPDRRTFLARWLAPLIALTAVAAVVLTLSRAVSPIDAFLGAAVVAVVLAGAALASTGSPRIEVERPGIGAVFGVLAWMAAVGAFVWLAVSWFGDS